MNIDVAMYYKASFSSYVTAIRFLLVSASNIKRRRSDKQRDKGDCRRLHNIVLNFVINDLRSGRSGRGLTPTPILSNGALLPFPTTDSSELARACRGVRYIMAETPTLLPYSIFSRHVRTYASTLHFTARELSS